MNKPTIALVCLTFLAGLWIIHPHTSLAQTRGFGGIIPFVTSTGSLGFFNQGSGKIYIYDNNLEQCIFQGQLGELGQPIQSLNAPNTQTNTAK